MRLVVSYSHGDEECCCLNVIPIEYESAEAFYCDLEKAVLTALKDTKRFWDDLQKTVDEKTKRREFPSPEVQVGGKLWQWDHFIEYGTEEFFPPTIETLDEWFESEK